MENTGERESLVTFKSSQGLEVRANITGMTRHAVTFEVYGPSGSLQASEVLPEFKIMTYGRQIYAGRATVNNLVANGAGEVCEATLTEAAWLDVELNAALAGKGGLQKKFGEFLQKWEKHYRIRPEYKVIIADMQSFFMDLRLWLDQVEMGIRLAPAAEQAALEFQAAEEVSEPIIACMNRFFEEFEGVALRLEEGEQAAHRNYMRRQLHPLILCAPFAYRTFEKPLGYAGDYEMVNMMVRNTHEGTSLFSKVVNTWFLRQAPAEAHRNRIDYLNSRLQQETARTMREGRPCRIMNLGCGPAGEVQAFLKDTQICDHAEFDLFDFNDDTIQYSSDLLNGLKRKYSRRAKLNFQRKSVLQVLKEAMKTGDRPARQYDVVYCAGLYDYLFDRTCQQLLDVFYDWTAPGGLIMTTNVAPSNPMRCGMEHLLDWHLIYRNAAQMLLVKPQKAEPDSVSVFSDVTGVNVMMEVRKPLHG